MPKYVAFLRAINVGGHTVKMDSLRLLFEELGFSNVETFIASGNVIFDARSKLTEALEQKIEKHLHQRLGYEVATFIRSLSDLAIIARHEPFAAASMQAPGHSVYVALLAGRPSDEAKRRLLSFTTEVDDFHVQEREVYWLCRKPMTESNFSG
ncbi:MAG: DUF1697 domain-containing protein, partial [Blastocatellia bacterium]